MIQITVGDNTYNSISQAWRAESPDGLPMITVRWRLKNGWNIRQALKTQKIPAILRRNWKEIREDLA